MTTPAPSARVEIVEAYQSAYLDPIRFETGEVVVVGREDPEGAGWFWCRAQTGKEGWVHRSFLAVPAGTTTSVDAYSAKELTAGGGERGTLLRVLDGWGQVQLDGGDVGWIPRSHLRPIE